MSLDLSDSELSQKFEVGSTCHAKHKCCPLAVDIGPRPTKRCVLLLTAPEIFVPKVQEIVVLTLLETDDRNLRRYKRKMDTSIQEDLRASNNGLTEVIRETL